MAQSKLTEDPTLSSNYMHLCFIMLISLLDKNTWGGPYCREVLLSG